MTTRLARGFLAAALATLLAAPSLLAQGPTRDPLPLARELVRKIHVGLASQHRAPWIPRSPRLRVDPSVLEGVWGTPDDLIPDDLPEGVPIETCESSCEPDRPGHLVIAFETPVWRGEDRATVVVVGRGLHPEDREVPEHPWRTRTRYVLERHGGEWIVVAVEPRTGS